MKRKIGSTLIKAKGRREHFRRVYNSWPEIHSMEVGDWIIVRHPRFFDATKQCAYRVGRKIGGKFSCSKSPPGCGKPIMIIERVE